MNAWGIVGIMFVGERLASANQGFIATSVFMAIVWVCIFGMFETIRTRIGKGQSFTDDEFNAMKAKSDKYKSGNDSMH